MRLYYGPFTLRTDASVSERVNGVNVFSEFDYHGNARVRTECKGVFRARRLAPVSSHLNSAGSYSMVVGS